MSQISSYAIDGKAVSRAYLNGKMLFSLSADYINYTNLDFANETPTTTVTTDDGGTTVAMYNYGNQLTCNQMGAIYLNEPGNVQPHAISQHFVATAAHYGASLPEIGDTSMLFDAAELVGKWTNLKTWALANGFDKHYLDTIPNIGDIVLAKINPTSDIADFIPYFYTPEFVHNNFYNGNLNGVIAWRIAQYEDDNNYAMQPVVMANNYTWGMPKDLYSIVENPTGKDAQTIAKNLSATYLGHTGDSGKPTYVLDSRTGNLVLVSQCYTNRMGPSYIDAYPVLKAFVEANGDTLNVIA